MLGWVKTCALRAKSKGSVSSLTQRLDRELRCPMAMTHHSSTGLRFASVRTAALRGRAQAIERVVLVGPSHYLPSPCAALPLRRSMTSKPRGQTPVDAAALAKVADLPFVVRSDAPHAPEHALEVELPFLQMLLASFRIVPLVVGDAAAQSAAEVLRILWGGPETLIVVSSD